MRIAIIGTGISGLSAAWLLNRDHDIKVYEKNNYIGGHSRTISVPVDGQDVAVDTGFIVFNKRNYPLLTRFFDHLKVPVIKSDMSFGVSIDNAWLEYGSKGMFAQKINLLRPQYWKMIFDIIRFNRQAVRYIDDAQNKTLAQCLDEMKMGDWFRRYYLQAMGAAIWSCSVETILQFPARAFLQFFKNHGLLTVNDHPQWYTVDGGSREYVSLMTKDFSDKIELNCGVVKVERKDGKVYILDEKNSWQEFDQVVFACHADQTLKLMANASAEEHKILGSFTYQKNEVVVHGDISFMPKRRKCWASWVYLSEHVKDHKPFLSLSYWMNNLQNLATKKPIIVTLNPGRAPAADRVFDRHVFDHPVFTLDAVNAQEKIDIIQGVNNTWHCGAYQRYGFHEDGLLSAVNVAEKMGVRLPW